MPASRMERAAVAAAAARPGPASPASKLRYNLRRPRVPAGKSRNQYEHSSPTRREPREPRVKAQDVIAVVDDPGEAFDEEVASRTGLAFGVGGESIQPHNYPSAANGCLTRIHEMFPDMRRPTRRAIVTATRSMKQ